MTYTILVTGSRNFPYPDLVVDSIKLTLHRLNQSLLNCNLVTGGARGVDTIAEKYWRNCGGKVTVVKPDWDMYGRAAGVLRNKDMVDRYEVDIILAFIYNHSRGSTQCYQYALDRQKPAILWPVSDKTRCEKVDIHNGKTVQCVLEAFHDVPCWFERNHKL